MTRVLLTGTTGRLGSAFLSLWSNHPQFSVSSLTRADANLGKPDELADVLCSHEFDVLVNPAAMSGLEECSDHEDEANAVNVRSPETMASVCREKNARFVHFSTDYVFGGHTSEKKSESHRPAPVNVYGKTKLDGELAVMQTNSDAIIARVSWLFGPTPVGRPCHFDQVLERAIAEEAQQYIYDKFSIPTFTHDVVDWTELLIENSDAQGIYHLCNSGEPESWHSSAEKLCNIAAENGIIKSPPPLKMLSLSDAHFFREQRPTHTAMQPDRLHREGIATPRHWLDAATEYLKIR